MAEEADFPAEMRSTARRIDSHHPYSADMLCRAADEIDRLRKLLSDIAEFCSGDDRTLGAIERLAHVQNTARRAALTNG